MKLNKVQKEFLDKEFDVNGYNVKLTRNILDTTPLISSCLSDNKMQEIANDMSERLINSNIKETDKDFKIKWAKIINDIVLEQCEYFFNTYSEEEVAEMIQNFQNLS